MRSGPIGVFDSGVGGLTVLRDIARALPLESLTYLGDNRRVPYGGLSPSTIAAFTIQGLDFLYEQGVKALVIACNTATVASLDVATRRYDVPVVGVVEPTAKAAAASGGRRIGVLATTATVRSGTYPVEIRKMNPDAAVAQQACPLLAGIVESGDVTSRSAMNAVRQCVEPLRGEGIDTLVLGCTHYPFLRAAIETMAGPGIRIVECGPPVVGEIKQLIRSGAIDAATQAGRMRLATTGSADSFRRLAAMLWTDESLLIEQVDIEVSDEQLHLQAA